MSLHSVLWTVPSFYVPSFRSMFRSLIQCAFLLFYGPSSLSMCLPSVLCAVLFLCAFVSFYVPFSHSMCFHSVLWTVLSFNVPSFCSMRRSLFLLAFIPFYEPSSPPFSPTHIPL